MRGSYFWLRMTRLYTQWLQSYQRKDRLSHYQKLTSLSAFGSVFFENFWEPMSVNVRVAVLVGYDETLHDLIEFGDSWDLQTY
jgi:uncharacterized membrane protein YbaN (DUF454 family)